MSVFGAGGAGKLCLVSLSCIRMNSEINIERMIMDHVDVFSWGISLRGSLDSQALT